MKKIKILLTILVLSSISFFYNTSFAHNEPPTNNNPIIIDNNKPIPEGGSITVPLNQLTIPDFEIDKLAEELAKLQSIMEQIYDEMLKNMTREERNAVIRYIEEQQQKLEVWKQKIQKYNEDNSK